MRSEKSREQRRQWATKHYAEHPEKWRERYERNKEYRRQKAKENRLKLRRSAINAYGGVCVCCGETRWELLSIDHEHNDGAQHRKSIKRPEDMFRWLRDNHYPSGFRVLCFNCNLSRGHLGYCPHETEKQS